ncbi:MAG: ribosome small subunit-dependent GTPase A [Betaproteobacteria bacterium]|nr:ribosome small subunit-dependent GTPase A [Betaproteobacteria bacterium]NBY06198.1 ribosome small subunit-dependent GTPase A [Betaproteobacteria bacterium]
MNQTGLVVASHGRHCWVENDLGERRICHHRGKNSTAVVGDRVQWLPSQDEGTIESIIPRRNLLYRQDELRTKSFAANLDQVLLLVAAEPEFSQDQMARALIACHAQGIEPIVMLNKCDLLEAFALAWDRLQPYRDMGQNILAVSLRSGVGVEELKVLLKGKTTLVLGPSGAGKSSLVNLLVPSARAATGEISKALQSGRHTTTSTHWYWLDDERLGALIDSPGFQEFGLHHLDPRDLAGFMPDLRAHLGECKFYNCTHLHEPGCGVRGALEQGQIEPSRYQIYQRLFDQLNGKL